MFVYNLHMNAIVHSIAVFLYIAFDEVADVCDRLTAGQIAQLLSSQILFIISGKRSIKSVPKPRNGKLCIKLILSTLFIWGNTQIN